VEWVTVRLIKNTWRGLAGQIVEMPAAIAAVYEQNGQAVSLLKKEETQQKRGVPGNGNHSNV
jgi:hypothetical protein